MNLKDALRGRRSVRRYEKRPVPRHIIAELIELAETAPSAGNLRARKYVVVMRPEMRKALAVAAYSQRPVEAAPQLIVVCADVDRSSARYGARGYLFSIQDATAATMCILLAAHDLGLGACWVGAFDDALVREALQLGERVLPVALIAIGWPAEMPQPPSGRSPDEATIWIE
jgi:nitroreductase